MMTKLMKAFVLTALAAPALAVAADEPSSVGKGAVESIARQPEAAGKIQINMILAAALIEGATLFAVFAGFGAK